MKTFIWSVFLNRPNSIKWGNEIVPQSLVQLGAQQTDASISASWEEGITGWVLFSIRLHLFSQITPTVSTRNRNLLFKMHSQKQLFWSSSKRFVTSLAEVYAIGFCLSPIDACIILSWRDELVIFEYSKTLFFFSECRDIMFSEYCWYLRAAGMQQSLYLYINIFQHIF